jgi:DNA (cytosine-5)-methyltransferase 1
MIAFSKPKAKKPAPLRHGKLLLEWIQQKRKSRLLKNPKGTLALADLFSGCGGLTLGALEAIRTAGYAADIRLSIDLEPACTATYAANFTTKAGTVICGSITDLVPGDPGQPLVEIEKALKAKVGSLDIVMAGPPCQGHSDLNNHSRRDDPKNKLYLKAVRFVEVTQPRIALIENVPTARHDKAQVVQTAAEFLRGIGYHVSFDTISAHRFGLPQSRRRLVLIATRTRDPEPLFERYRNEAGHFSLRQLIGDLEDEPKNSTDIYRTPSKMTKPNVHRVNFLFAENKYDLPNHKRPVCHQNDEHSYKSMYGRLHWDRLAQTITGGFGSMGQGRFVHPSRKRVITPHEAARIQGFPDYFDFGTVQKRTTLHQMIGNAVPPIMAYCPIFDLINEGYI